MGHFSVGWPGDSSTCSLSGGSGRCCRSGQGETKGWPTLPRPYSEGIRNTTFARRPTTGMSTSVATGLGGCWQGSGGVAGCVAGTSWPRCQACTQLLALESDSWASGALRLNTGYLLGGWGVYLEVINFKEASCLLCKQPMMLCAVPSKDKSS